MTTYTIVHATGDLRSQAQQYLTTNHYTRSNGGSGTMFAVVPSDVPQTHVCGAVLIGATASTNCDRSLVAGAVLIGPASSRDAERSVAQPGVLVRQIKRSHLADDVPVTALCESQLLRTAMQQTTDHYDQPVLFVSYADPAACDSRDGRPLAGWS